MIEKELKDTVASILVTAGMEYDDLIADGRQTGLGQFV